jgi:ferric-dicitrate binding protein FerR (iron transport regulator)
MWVAQLHAPSRNAETESGVQRWLAESPAHAAAFKRATQVWNKTGNLHAGLPQRGGRDAFEKKISFGNFVAAVLLKLRARKQPRE